MKPKKLTIALDFDKSIAVRNKGDNIFKCGPAIPAMVERVKQWLADGHKVVIFTARSGDAQVKPVKQFLKDNGLPDLEVTNVKTSRMDCFVDDRAKELVPNEGEFIVDLLHDELLEGIKIVEILRGIIIKNSIPEDGFSLRDVDEWISKIKHEVGKDKI
jgi:hypothetical protein